MPTFVTIEPDPFATSFQGAVIGDPREENTSMAGGKMRTRRGTPVRRPVRGIQIKEDTYATIQVRTADGRNIPLIDAGGFHEDERNPGRAYTHDYTNFLLQSVQEQRAEKMQVVQTFGAPFVFFFGEHPRMISGSGVLLNTEDFNWRAEFWDNYNKYLRGTKCVQSKSRVTLQWDDIVVEGYFIKAIAQEQSQTPNYVQLQFEVFLTNYQNISAIGVADFPNASMSSLDIGKFTLDTTGEGIGNLKSMTADVRELNAASIESIRSKNRGLKGSLMSLLRDSWTSMVNLDGHLTALVEAASGILPRGKVHAPFGYTGGSVYDQDTQIALASVDPNSRSIILRERLSEELVRRTMARKMIRSSIRRGKITLNVDEYIQRSKDDLLLKPLRPSDLDVLQKVDTKEITDRVRAVFERYGVSTDPPNEILLAAKDAAFGVFSVVAGTVAHDTEEAADLRRVTNMMSMS